MSIKTLTIINKLASIKYIVTSKQDKCLCFVCRCSGENVIFTALVSLLLKPEQIYTHARKVYRKMNSQLGKCELRYIFSDSNLSDFITDHGMCLYGVLNIKPLSK